MENERNENVSPEEERRQETREETTPAETGAIEEAPREAAPDEAGPMEPANEAEAPEKTGKEPNEPEEGPGRNRGLRSGRFKRGGMATLMSVVFIAIVVVLNILVGALEDRFPSMSIDLTANKLNTPSDQAMEIAEGVENDTTVYLIGAEEKYRKDQIYSSYGLEYSQVANLAEKLAEKNPRISVQFVDPDANPTFISQYSAENLGTGSVLVKTDKRYKALQASDLFDVTTNSSTYQTETYSKVDSALASALETVNLDNVPVVTIATGHGEMLGKDNMESFLDMLETQNFEVREIEILTEEIPEDTQILMIPTPTTDYTAEEIDKLRAYLDDDQRAQQVTLLVTCHSSQANLPNLSAFLEEWGIHVEDGVVAESDSSRMVAGSAGYVLADANQEEVLQDDDYNNLVAGMSRPLTLLFKGNGDVATQALWNTSDSAYVVTEEMTELPEDPETGSYTVAAIGAKFLRIDEEDYRHSVVVFGSSYVFLDSFIDATAYGNSKYLKDLMQYCTGTDDSTVTTVRTQSVQTNVLDVSASTGTVTLLGLGVFTIGVPLFIVVIGLVVFLRRRHL